MIDYKQLCAELLDWTRLLIEIPDPPVTRCADDLTDLLARTRAALAEPKPESELRNNTLSPAAYAIIAAAHQQGHTNRRGLAAALRAAVDQASPEKQVDDIDYVHQSYVDGMKDALAVLREIADELENNDD